MTEDEMLGDGSPSILVGEHVFEENPGVGDGQGSLGAAVHGVAKSRT